jgi:hypothetical protein
MAFRPFFPEGDYGPGSENWVVRYGIPVGFLTYGLTMVYARFMAPIVLLAMFILTDSVLLTLRSNLGHRDYFSQGFREEVSKSIDKSATIFAPVIAPISPESGHIAMWELRRTLTFPNAKRMPNRSILPEADVQQAVAELVKGLGPGSIVIVPAAAAGGDRTCRFSDCRRGLVPLSNHYARRTLGQT